MAKGNRGGKKRTVIASNKDSITINGDKIEYEGNLTQTINDPSLNATQRSIVEAWEKKRENQKIEYANAVGYNGSEYGEIRGTRNHVNTPKYYQENKGSVFTHIHPRDSGMLGGTFSVADIQNWVYKASQTKRAVAKEGTYSISKGKNFNARQFMAYYSNAYKTEEKVYSAKVKGLMNQLSSGQIGIKQFGSESNKAFNTFLVALHKDLMDNQNTYGYHYYLEKR